MVSDTAITIAVKNAFATEARAQAVGGGRAGDGIFVETVQGLVRLSGSVDSPDEKTRAGEVATEVIGVVRVANMIVMR